MNIFSQVPGSRSFTQSSNNNLPSYSPPSRSLADGTTPEGTDFRPELRDQRMPYPPLPPDEHPSRTTTALLPYRGDAQLELYSGLDGGPNETTTTSGPSTEDRSSSGREDRGGVVVPLHGDRGDSSRQRGGADGSRRRTTDVVHSGSSSSSSSVQLLSESPPKVHLGATFGATLGSSSAEGAHGTTVVAGGGTIAAPSNPFSADAGVPSSRSIVPPSIGAANLQGQSGVQPLSGGLDPRTSSSGRVPPFTFTGRTPTGTDGRTGNDAVVLAGDRTSLQLPSNSSSADRSRGSADQQGSADRKPRANSGGNYVLDRHNVGDECGTRRGEYVPTNTSERAMLRRYILNGRNVPTSWLCGRVEPRTLY